MLWYSGVTSDVYLVPIWSFIQSHVNLGEKRYVESLFTNGKSHLLRNVINKIIYHQSSRNASTAASRTTESRAASLGRSVNLTVSPGHKYKSSGVSPYWSATWVEYAGGRYFLRRKWLCRANILFGCARTKKSDHGQTCDILWVNTLQL